MSWAWLLVGLVALQRLAELFIARRNTRRLLARGGVEVGAGHYPLIVLTHVAWLAAILVLVPSLGAYVTPRVMGGGNQLMIGNLIELQFGQGRNWPLGAALSITLLAIVMVALLAYVRAAGNEEVQHG